MTRDEAHAVLEVLADNAALRTQRISGLLTDIARKLGNLADIARSARKK